MSAMRYDVERDQEREQSQPAPASEQAQALAPREQLASAVGNSAMQRAAASPEKSPRTLLSGAPMSIARFSGVDLAQRPSGALPEPEEEAPQAPEGPKETPPAEASAPAQAPATEPETLEPVEESEPGNYNAEEESYI
jgi:hypothetical protein